MNLRGGCCATVQSPASRLSRCFRGPGLVRFRSRRIALTQKPKTAIVVRRYFRATRSSPNTSELFHQQESVCNLCASGSERGVSSSFRKGSVTRPEGSANSMIKERTFRSYLFRKNFSTHRPKNSFRGGKHTHAFENVVKRES